MKITTRDRKALLIGAVAAGVFMVLKLGLFPVYETFVDMKKNIVLKQQAKEKYMKFLANLADIKKGQKGSAKDEISLQRSLLKGETPSLAAADIQKIVDGITKESKVDVQSVKIMDPEPREKFTVIPVQIMFSSDLTRLQKFIRSIETDRKLLTIPELKIRVKNEQKPQDVSVTIQVAGYVTKNDTKTN